MIEHEKTSLISAIFITFSGNCKKALTYYQTCFGGRLHFETFERELQGYEEIIVVSGSLISDRIIIHGSDLVYDEGRILGNHMSIFLHCKSNYERKSLLERLEFHKNVPLVKDHNDQKLIEVIDGFDVRWVLGV